MSFFWCALALSTVHGGTDASHPGSAPIDLYKGEFERLSCRNSFTLVTQLMHTGLYSQNRTGTRARYSFYASQHGAVWSSSMLADKGLWVTDWDLFMISPTSPIFTSCLWKHVCMRQLQKLQVRQKKKSWNSPVTLLICAPWALVILEKQAEGWQSGPGQSAFLAFPVLVRLVGDSFLESGVE